MLKNCVRLLISMGPIIYILNIISSWRHWNTILLISQHGHGSWADRVVNDGFWAFMPFFSLWVAVLFLCAAASFVCVFINARKHDKSLNMKRALMFW